MVGKPRHWNRRRRLAAVSTPAIERLESRRLLTGNVTVELKRDDVHIEGDRHDNSISITVSQAGLTITGRNQTTVNGRPELFIPAASLPAEIDDVYIRMGAGNDTVDANLSGVVIHDDLHVDLGSGNDRISAVGGSVGHNARIYGGADNDVVEWSGFTVANDLSVFLGSGNNNLTLNNGTVNDDISVHGGRDSDRLTMRSLTIADNAHLFTDGGNDFVSVADSRVGGNALVALGSGNDELVVTNSRFAGRTSALGGSGFDTIRVTGSLFARDPWVHSFERMFGDLAAAGLV